MKSEIMTIHDVAKYLGVCTMTVYRLARKKQLPLFRVGGSWRAKKSVLDTYLNAN